MTAWFWLVACGDDPPTKWTSPSDADADVDADTDTDTDADCEAPTPPDAPLRLLTRTQVDHAVEYLVGVPGTTRDRLPPDPTVHGFEGAASTVAVSQLLADGWMRAAEDATAAVDVSAVTGCAADDRACALAFVDDFGGRAFRRPLEVAERDVFVALFDDLLADEGYDGASTAVIEATLQSPQFLYRIELGEPGAPGDVVALTPHELATRLSLLLWDTVPDAALRAAADDGSLADVAVLGDHADRLLADPRAREGVGRWVEQWTGLSRMESEPRDPTAYPDWSPTLAADLRDEVRRFAVGTVFDGDGTLEALLTSRVAWVNGPVAAVYGVAGPSDPAEWVEVELPQAERAGLLTRAGLMATNAHANQTSPVHRGLFVYEQVFCGVQPPPPGDLDITLPPLDDALSTRERLARHTQDPLCSGCHSRLDPVGFGFEHYDAIGAWRDTEGDGVSIDASGYLPYSDAAGPFTGALELSDALAGDDSVRSCFTVQWFRSAFGREVGDGDVCTMETVDAAFVDGGVTDLLRALATSDSFRHRAAVTP